MFQLWTHILNFVIRSFRITFIPRDGTGIKQILNSKIMGLKEIVGAVFEIRVATKHTNQLTHLGKRIRLNFRKSKTLYFH